MAMAMLDSLVCLHLVLLASQLQSTHFHDSLHGSSSLKAISLTSYSHIQMTGRMHFITCALTRTRTHHFRRVQLLPLAAAPLVLCSSLLWRLIFPVAVVVVSSWSGSAAACCVSTAPPRSPAAKWSPMEVRRATAHRRTMEGCRWASSQMHGHSTGFLSLVYCSQSPRNHAACA